MRLVATFNNTQHCMSCQTFSVDKILLNSIFPIIFPSGKYTLIGINSCIIKISPQLTKKAQNLIYSYQSRIFLLSLNMFSSLLSYLSRWLGTFICQLEWLLEESLRSVWLPLIIFEKYLWDSPPTSNKVADIGACKIYEIWTLSTGVFTAIQ